MSIRRYLLIFSILILSLQTVDAQQTETPQLTYDEVFTGEFTEYNQTQDLTFTGERYRTVQFAFRPTGNNISSGGGNGFSFSVFLPSGDELDYQIGRGGVFEVVSTYFQLPETGAYTIILDAGRRIAEYEFVVNSRLINADVAMLEGRIHPQSERYYVDIQAEAGDIIAITTISTGHHLRLGFQNNGLRTDSGSAGNLNAQIIEPIRRDGIYTVRVERVSNVELTFQLHFDVLIQKITGERIQFANPQTLTERTQVWFSAKPGDYFGLFGTDAETTIYTPAGEAVSLDDGTFIAEAYGIYQAEAIPTEAEATFTIHKIADYVLDISPITVRLHSQQERIQLRAIDNNWVGASFEINHSSGSDDYPFHVFVEQNGRMLATYTGGSGSRGVTISVSLDHNSSSPVTVTISQNVPSSSSLTNAVTIRSNFFAGGMG